jgi:glycosyltransferase involved in cell wall biosynthesis
VAEVAKRLPHLVFVMAGDGELRETISSSAPQNLKIVGVQGAAEMWAIADLALLTSDSEGMPLSIIEAQMSGVPVVATNVGSVSEIVEDGVTGKLSRVDADDIASSIVELAANPSRLEEMRRAAKSRAGSLFSREVMVDKHIEVYREVLDKVTK